jgi:hypothetical protein
MTREAFILGILTSLIATILFELARKGYSLLRHTSFSFEGVLNKILSLRVYTPLLVCSFVLLIVIELPLPTALAPTSEVSTSKTPTPVTSTELPENWTYINPEDKESYLLAKPQYILSYDKANWTCWCLSKDWLTPASSL